MTEHVVLTRATAYRAELDRRERIALQSLSAVRAEKERIESFLELYTRFSSLPDMQQPAQTEDDHHSGDTGDQAAGVPLAPAAAIQPETATQSTAARKDVHTNRDSSDNGDMPECSGKTGDDGQSCSAMSNILAGALRKQTEPAGTQALPVDTNSSEAANETGAAGVSSADALSSGTATREDAGLSAPATKPLVRDRVKALHAEHPELTYAEAEERLGLSRGAVSGHCSILGIKFRAAKAAPAAAQKDDGTESRRRKYGAPEPQVEPEPESIVPPAVVKLGPPDAKWFRLRRQDGMWLHMSGSGFTGHKPDSWIGRIGQLRAARTRFPDTKGLVIVGETAVAK